jgi:hypothetical protein
MPRKYHLCSALVLGLLSLAVPALSAVYGLVVGIDAYEHYPPLQGAGNDARAVAEALRAASVQELVVLLDREATRHKILETWQRFVRQAKPGDTIIFTYAGHGAQEPEHIVGNEQDGKDEVLVLAGFDTRQRNSERIRDDEIQELFQSAAHLKIIFIADACYSGTLTRSASLPVRTRTIGDYGKIEYDQLPRPKPTAKTSPEGDLPHVTFFSASREHEVTPEVRIEGRIHGALSWSFAQAVRGAADHDRDGILRKGEVEHFVLENVRMRTEYQQHPQVQPEGGATTPLLALRPATPPSLAIVSSADLILLHITGTNAPRATMLYQQMRRITPVHEKTSADLVWDVQKAEVLGALGDVVAYFPDNTPSAMQQVVDKWAMLQTVRSLSAQRSLRLRVEPGDDLHRRGTLLRVSLEEQRYPYLTLFNLTADGTVQFLYPVAQHGDPLQIAVDRPFRLPPIRVTQPFGAEHLVAVVSQTPLQALHRTIQQLHGRALASQLEAALKQQVAGVSYQMGVLGLYTAE